MKKRTHSNIKVRVFLGDVEVKEKNYSKLVISNTSVNRIINDVVDRLASVNEEVETKLVA